jgi:phytoene desaturase
MRKKVIVIGSGFGGIGAAIRLAAAGYEVSIFEKRDRIGGRAYQYQIDGYTFDGGPTVITAPFMFDELFALAGRQREDYFQLEPLDPFYRIFHPQGGHFDYFHQPDQMLAEVERWSPQDVDGYRRLMRHIAQIFEVLHPYTYLPVSDVKTMSRLMPEIIRLAGFLGVHDFASLYLKNPFLRQVFSFHPLLVGGNPYSTPALYTLIAQFERQWGVHYAMGGTGSIVRALGCLFEELGGQIHLNAEVDEITCQGRSVTGIRMRDGTHHKADVIVCNGDVAHTYRYLIPSQARRKNTNGHIDRMKYSMSLFVLYFGTRRRYTDTQLLHHNLIINQDYNHLMRDIFANRPLREDFALYMHMPSRTDRSVAPQDGETFYVLAPVPNLSKETDWNALAPLYRERILGFLEAGYLPGLRENLGAVHHIDPFHFRDTLNSYRGAAFSVLPSLTQLGWFRPHNRSEDLDNLYFVGAGTHPGAGVPAVLASGKIAADLITAAEPAPVSGPLPAATPKRARSWLPFKPGKQPGP